MEEKFWKKFKVLFSFAPIDRVIKISGLLYRHSYLSPMPLPYFMVSHTNFNSTYSTKNSTELVEKLNCITRVPSSAILVSFDIVSLFTNVPIQLTLRIVKEILDDSKIDNETALEFLRLLGLCAVTNFCNFLGSYKFNDGLPMGSPIASRMAEIFLNALEKYMYGNSPYMRFDVLFWCRYVDDVFCVFDGLPTTFTEFAHNSQLVSRRFS